jgi:hypothetical protein
MHACAMAHRVVREGQDRPGQLVDPADAIDLVIGHRLRARAILCGQLVVDRVVGEGQAKKGDADCARKSLGEGDVMY